MARTKSGRELNVKDKLSRLTYVQVCKHLGEKADALLAAGGIREISIDDIVARAGSSKGSFYQRFADKDSLLVYLLRVENDATITAWTEFFTPPKWDDCSLATVLDAFITRLMEIYRGMRNVKR